LVILVHLRDVLKELHNYKWLSSVTEKTSEQKQNLKMLIFESHINVKALKEILTI
jgi:hypothetical protein